MTPFLDVKTRKNTQKNRIRGLDIARAVAIIGMTVEHFGPASWGVWAIGWPSILFALLSGMSLAIMVRHGAEAGVPVSGVRRRIAVRGLVLLAVGIPLASAGADMVIVLATFGMSFLLCSMLVTLSGPRLLALGAAGTVVLPQLSYWLRQHVFPSTGGEIGAVPRLDHFTSVDGAGTALRALFLDGEYPLFGWLPVIVVGMGVMTLGVHGTARAAWAGLGALSAVGSCLFTWAMVAGAGVQPSILSALGTGVRDIAEAGGAGVIETWRTVTTSYGTTVTADDLLLNEAHSGSTPDLLFGIGVSLVVVMVCLWVGEVPALRLTPLVALGSCAFTVYVGQALASAAVNHWFTGIHDEPGSSVVPLVLYLGVPLLFCTVWKLFFRRGPLEHLMHLASTAGREPRPQHRTLTGMTPD